MARYRGEVAIRLGNEGEMELYARLVHLGEEGACKTQMVLILQEDVLKTLRGEDKKPGWVLSEGESLRASDYLP